MCFNIKYSCHTITNIIHGRRLSLQLMTNWSLTCNYSNACLRLLYRLVTIDQWKKKIKGHGWLLTDFWLFSRCLFSLVGNSSPPPVGHCLFLGSWVETVALVWHHRRLFDWTQMIVQRSLEHYGIGTIHYISDVFRKTVEECCSSVPKSKTVVA